MLGAQNAAQLVGRSIEAIPGAAPIAALRREHPSDQVDQELTLGGKGRRVRLRPHRHGAVVLLSDASAASNRHVARYTFDDLLTRDPDVLRAIDAARQTAQSAVPILITGPSGTGKEVLAQAIHSASPRSGEPFLAVNVAAIPAELLESELFGYESGAFTGARSQGKPGAFELAGQGTLLLDEIGEMPVEMQSKLLRVLQERQVQRLGGTVPIPVHARMLATTNRDLQEQVKAGSFRLDLFYRLRVVSIELPALRERPGDIPLLVEHFLRQACTQLGRPPVDLSPSVLDQLVHHPWPGNVRELSNLLLGVVSLLPEQERTIVELPVFLSRRPPHRTTSPGAAAEIPRRGRARGHRAHPEASRRERVEGREDPRHLQDDALQETAVRARKLGILVARWRDRR